MASQAQPEAGLALKIERTCARMGMEPDEPLRQLLTSSAKAHDNLRREINRVSHEAAQRAADGAMREVRDGMRRAALELSLTRKVLYAAVPMLAGFTAGTPDAATNALLAYKAGGHEGNHEGKEASSAAAAAATRPRAEASAARRGSIA